MDEGRLTEIDPPLQKIFAVATSLHRDSDESDVSGKMTLDGSQRENGYLSIPGASTTATETFTIANGDHDCSHDGTKDYFSCSSSSAALSSTRSASLASGTSDSAVVLSQSFGQAFTPLSMGDSDLGAEDHEAAIRNDNSNSDEENDAVMVGNSIDSNFDNSQHDVGVHADTGSASESRLKNGRGRSCAAKICGGPAGDAKCHAQQSAACTCEPHVQNRKHQSAHSESDQHMNWDQLGYHPSPTLPLLEAQLASTTTRISTTTGGAGINDAANNASSSNSPRRANSAACEDIADAATATPGARDPTRPENSKPGLHNHYTPEDGHDRNNLVSSHRRGISPSSSQGGNITNTSPNSKNIPPIDAAFPLNEIITSPSASRVPASSSSPALSSISQQQYNQETGDLRPLIRTASDNLSLRIQHPTPDINPKTGAYLGNIAQLEATAERLSTSTSSIEDAIRDLHAELKRSDSQRPAAARARVGPPVVEEEAEEEENSLFHLRRPPLLRHLSASASIASLNGIPRQPPYRSRSNSSINQPLRYRNRSGSLNAAMQQHNDHIRAEFEPSLSRAGPGKGSVRSVRTGKLSLAEIVEAEPISLTQAALDEADRANVTEEDDDTIRGQTIHDDKTPIDDSVAPNTDAFHAMLGGSALGLPGPELGLDPSQRYPDHPVHYEEPRPRSSSSDTSSLNLKNAFGDFDGVHFQPELYSPPLEMQALPPQSPRSPPRGPRSPTRQPMPRPTSYMDPHTGQEMLYYPARVPAMLNLPPKLSRKPKAASRNIRQSEVLNAMPEMSRKSAAWLPDPLEGHAGSAFSSPLSMDESMGGIPGPMFPPEHPFAATVLPTPGPSAPEIQVTETEMAADLPATPVDLPPVTSNILPPTAEGDDDVKPAVPRPRKQQPTPADDVEARKSRLSKLPPQLRASVFFDLPSTSTKLKVKDGSASATLDDLLNASANAPVSAFTDHLIAGKLGSEVYGPEKKRRSAMPKTSTDSDPKKRNTYLRSQKSTDALDADKRASDLSPASASLNGSSGPAGSTLDDMPLPPGAVGYATLSPDSDEFDEADKKPKDGEDSDGKSDENEEYNELYHGPPTTLLAELQIRKQQQKNRTRLPANPNGMHSTLLEMDAVAEAQRRNRKGKRVNLAWEDPVVDGYNEEDDEDVPLGVLYAAKATGANNLAAAAAELDRPLGLMERRELEENEPLSQRKARLQGGDPHRSAILTKRQTLMMNVGVTFNGNRLSQMPSNGNMGPLPSPGVDAEEEEEVEGETLGERMRRLKNKEEAERPLPLARPVSTAFTSELLSQFGEPEEDKQKEPENKGGEEEETLGQRRRRLQAEREAREAEIGFAEARPVSQLMPGAAPANHRLSMAGILSAHPRKDTSLQDVERRKFEEDMRLQREQEEKMAALRSQMPTTLLAPSTNNTGAFRNGQFNDGTGGTGSRRVPSQSNLSFDVGAGSWNRSSVAFNNGGIIQQAGVTSMRSPYGAGQYGGMASSGWYGQTPLQMGTPMQMGMPGINMQMPMPNQTPMQMQMGQQPMAPPMAMPMGMSGGYQVNPQGQSDMVERWRHGVM
ncbi:hypothetical protein jhhlp_002662 [Lomentospora prolificans]|uniref:Uncharacterized protein n=1 Tax=Lomentospora prolificans TaxID=41688 RepID=A0A2N3NEP7_9PEZI|nr:hypothetical protein jhhlp_002662 [Lomentospora prolificans]